jgi:GH24 family phage-related lysozyme (muramidase)
MYNTADLRAELSRDEARRTRPYRDSEGILTVGVGWNLEAHGLPLEVIERLLTAHGLPEPDVDLLLDMGIARAEADMDALLPGWRETLDPVRQRVLLNMAFNLGRARLDAFARMWAAVRARDWTTAAAEMMDSKWARQVGVRAARLERMMREGA